MPCLELPYSGSNRRYNFFKEGFVVSIVLGSRRLEHSGMLLTDAVIVRSVLLNCRFMGDGMPIKKSVKFVPNML